MFKLADVLAVLKRWRLAIILLFALFALALSPWIAPWFYWDSNPTTQWVPPPPDNVNLNSTDQFTLLAPKIIHHRWNDENVPEKWAAVRKRCMEMHPDYKFMLWTYEKERELLKEHFPSFLSTYDKCATAPLPSASLFPCSSGLGSLPALAHLPRDRHGLRRSRPCMLCCCRPVLWQQRLPGLLLPPWRRLRAPAPAGLLPLGLTALLHHRLAPLPPFPPASAGKARCPPEAPPRPNSAGAPARLGRQTAVAPP